ncbi:MAG: S9 family peptidase, partial [Candidatus Heimdallarchaeota archaeon]|nr:S9 family peptidase [Candidatus Heimdallarchaeota archaeon]MCK5048516.1 S9 family peptidase [Candidatus Heimdallarchaeota archaeon]
YNPPFFLYGGRLHPSNKWLVYGANYDFEKEEVLEPSWLYRHDLETGEKKILAKPEKPAWYFPQFNPEGSQVLYSKEERDPSGNQYWLVSIEGENDREILNFGDKIKISASWVNNEQIVFLKESSKEEVQYRSIGIYSIDSEEIEWLIDDPSKNIEYCWVPENNDRYVFYMEVEKAKNKASMIDLETKEITSLPRIRGSLIPIARINDQEWIGSYYSSTQPADIVKFNPKDCEIEKFSSLTDVWTRTKISAEQLTPAEEFEWTSKDGERIHGWLYQPKAGNGKTVLYIHGGPTSHSKDRISTEIQYYVSKGFTVLDPNYRGSTGYGLAFQDLIKKDGWGGLEQDDISTAAQALIKEGIATAGKIGITGTSYGGYSSWFAITKFPEVFSSSVPICGMTDLVVDYETTRPDLRNYSEEMLGGKPTDVPEIYFDRSPINFIKNIKGAVLVVQGANDPNVTPANLETMEIALNDNNIAFEQLVFDDEGHGILKPANEYILYKKLAKFFNETL